MTCRVTEVFMDASAFEPVQGLGTRCWSVGRSPVPRAKTDVRAFRRLTNPFEIPRGCHCYLVNAVLSLHPRGNPHKMPAIQPHEIDCDQSREPRSALR